MLRVWIILFILSRLLYSHGVLRQMLRVFDYLRPVVAVLTAFTALIWLLPASAVESQINASREWRVHGGDPGHRQNSELAQINKRNVHRLRAAWIYHTGDKRDDNRSQIQCNPIVVDSVLYATSPQLKVFALKAATGEPLWTFDPIPRKPRQSCANPWRSQP